MKQIIKKNWILLLIILVAVFLRFLGEYPGFPDNHPDEGISFTTGVYMLFHFMEPNRFDYPAGVPFIQTISYIVFFIPLALFKLLISQPNLLISFFTKGFNFFTQYHDAIFGLRDINAMFWSRYVVGFFGVCTVALVYMVAKKLFNRQTGLIAAFFLAVNYRHVIGSHLGLPDPYNGLFSLLSFYASYLLLEKQTWKRYVFAGISMGMAIAMKYQIFVFIPFFLVHLIILFRRKNIAVMFNRKVISAMFLAVGVFLFINPYIFKNLKEFLFQSNLTYMWYQMGQYKFRFYPYFYLFHWGLGVLPTLVIMAGAALMIKKNLLKFLLLSSFIIPFFFVLTIYSNGGIYTRNFISVIPFLVIFAGYFISTMFEYVKKTFWSGAALAFVVIAINITSINNSFISSFYYAKTWNSDVLMNWMETNLPANISLRNHNLILTWKNRDQYTSTLEKKHISQLDWNYNRDASSLAEFQAEKVDFAIINDNSLQSMTYWWRQWDTDKLIKYSQIPFDYIRNGFYGLSATELMDYSVKEIYKPWQAMTTGNYIVIKIPQKLIDVGNKIAEFNFDNKNDTWSLRGLMNLKPISFNYAATVGKNRNGSIAIYGKGEGNTSRISSPAIPVKEGKMYTVRGWIKNSAEKLGIDRESFLRIDFYKNADNLDTLGISVALSPRAPIINEWVQEEVQAKAPKGARYMTISFQRANAPRSVPQQNFTSYLDDVQVFQSDMLQDETFKELPYTKSAIPVEDLYLNTFL